MRHWLPVLLSLAIAGCGVAPAAPTAATQQAASAQASALRGMDAYLDEVFAAADTNRDGQLSAKESGLVHEQIAVLDKNQDGAVSRSEWQAKATLGQIMKGLPAFLPFVLNLHTALDANRNRLVTLGEVRKALGESRSPLAALSPDSIEATFSAADADRNGGLNGDEFQGFYLDLGALPAERGMFRRAAMALLGTYVSVMSHIAAPKALHPVRNPIRHTPSKWGWAYEDVSFKAEDGVSIKGWYVPAKTATKKTLVMVHGISDNRDWFVRMGVLPMVHDDYNVLAIDLRNHGESEGTVTSFAYHEAKDVVAAVKYLKGRGIDSVALYGVSLGGASAIRAAALMPQVKAVVDDCAYATVSQAFTGFISLSMIPSPVLVGAATLVQANRILGVDMSTTEPLTQVAKIAPRPFLVIHGAQDKNVPVDNSRTNFLAAGDGLKKELWIVPGGEHAASAVAQPEEYKARLQAFLKQVAW
ncbi:acyl-CoA esterase [compost metagenome]